ncbi:hypothetical protein [Paenibacillus massiliensis]|uniref:hypothetical protein n=1 Tax=Paenibacillus massiliensis TaxID=225917 RepID=UPI00037E7EB4|nr:hypothetical protein [Paenibacillus massiliensis]
MKQKLILFFATGVPYGLCMGLFMRVYSDSWLVSSLIFGVVFGLFMTGIASLIQWINLKRLGYEKGKIQVRNTIELEVEGTKQEIFETCTSSLRMLTRTKLKEHNLARGMIVATTGVNWLTWGEVVSFQMESVDEQRWRIEIDSRPALRTTVIDYGKSRENLSQILGYFRVSKLSFQVVRDENAIS